MTPEEAIQEAQSGELRRVYLVHGDERFLVDQVVTALRAAATAGGVAGLNDDVIDAAPNNVDSATSIARTLPMMASRRCVLVRQVERFEPKKDSKGKSALDKLTQYVEDPAESTVLILVSSSLDKRRKVFTLAKKQGWLVSCEPLSRNVLPTWIQARVRARGNTIAHHVADLLAEIAGPELGSLDDAVERLTLFVGPNEPITEDAVAECIVRVRPTTVWELVGAVANRNVGAALGHLSRVYDPQDRGLRLVGVLAWSARQLIKFDAATRRGLPPAEAAKLAGAPPFKANQLASQVKRIPRAALEQWLDTLAEVDLALKGGSSRPPQAVLEHTIIRLCTGNP